MRRDYKRSGKERNSQNGFVLVAALIAVMILMAIGIFALTTSSQDIVSAARSVSEGNALTGAEAGVHNLCATFDPGALADISKTAVPGSSANVSFNVTRQMRTDIMDHSPGMPPEWHYDIYNAQVTGFDNKLNGQVTLQIGLVDPIPRQ